MTVENRILGFSNFEQDRIEFFAINEKKKDFNSSGQYDFNIPFNFTYIT